MPIFSSAWLLTDGYSYDAANRYMCSDLRCITSNTQYFQTWTSLQAHIRHKHPPTCTYLECEGRTFSSHKNLKAHLKTHEEHDLQGVLERELGAENADTKRNLDVGRDWDCEWEDCSKSFKSVRTNLRLRPLLTHLFRKMP